MSQKKSARWIFGVLGATILCGWILGIAFLVNPAQTPNPPISIKLPPTVTPEVVTTGLLSFDLHKETRFVVHDGSASYSFLYSDGKLSTPINCKYEVVPGPAKAPLTIHITCSKNLSLVFTRLKSSVQISSSINKIELYR